ncbi:hypothetical protein D6853_01010 [Butyrivibrio sp. X503]|uniref:DUF6044 family protein n=1 Tax=Butyrivibrio sp. X503 TaxID=2364878 RepID=UPI000EA8E64B|nr:DUF6044 family protein [Butyrivibrio sp. X503]RKM58148.1 hypothetical protein D6853_01010 [Butyrivibrio sp. X503]
MAALKKHFSIIIVALFVASVALFYMIIGDNSYIAVHDNLDLFIAQFAMLKNTGSFFAHGVSAPFLGGISRDVLPSEFSLYTVLYMLFPLFAAYVIGYILKVLIAVFSMRLLIVDVLKDRSGKEKDDLAEETNIATLIGLLYGVLNLFPAFGIPFASIPLIVFLLRRMYISPRYGKSPIYLLLIFLYPFVSYFSYFGFFIIGYIFFAIIWLWIKDKKVPVGLVKSILVLTIGYVIMEYRLFDMMLFSDTVTIRETMDPGFMSGKEVLRLMVDAFVNGMMHADDVHKFLVMPVCVIYFFFLNIRYIVKKNVRGIFKDIYNLGALMLVLNAVVYGIYYYEPANKLLGMIAPPLKGFQFNRTIFFNPVIWCLMFFIVIYRVKVHQIVKYAAALAAVAIVLLTPGRYNDLYTTAHHTVRALVFGNENDELNYREFYSTSLFENIKKDIGYTDGEWSVAYGMHPAILEYNGISTLDGYLGFYPQSYKESFRKVIAPALEKKELTRAYFDDWGARCYLYSGTDDSIVMATKSMTGVTDNTLYVDTSALKDMGCKYIFSRIELSNASELSLELLGDYKGDDSPYTIYVYKTK